MSNSSKLQRRNQIIVSFPTMAKGRPWLDLNQVTYILLALVLDPMYTYFGLYTNSLNQLDTPSPKEFSSAGGARKG